MELIQYPSFKVLTILINSQGRLLYSMHSTPVGLHLVTKSRDATLLCISEKKHHWDMFCRLTGTVKLTDKKYYN